MSVIAFDTLKFVRKLETAGIPAAEAEAIAVAFSEAQGGLDLATKHDLRELEYRMTIKLGGLMIAAVGIVATLVKLL